MSDAMKAFCAEHGITVDSMRLRQITRHKSYYSEKMVDDHQRRWICVLYREPVTRYFPVISNVIAGSVKENAFERSMTVEVGCGMGVNMGGVPRPSNKRMLDGAWVNSLHQVWDREKPSAPEVLTLVLEDARLLEEIESIDELRDHLGEVTEETYLTLRKTRRDLKRFLGYTLFRAAMKIAEDEESGETSGEEVPPNEKSEQSSEESDE